MLKNYIVDNDIEGYYPDLISVRRGGQVDFSATIDRAFRDMIDDFQRRGKNPRLMMVPIDLNRDASSTMLQYLLSASVTGDDNGYAWFGNGREGRFVVNMTGRTGDSAWTVKLQGSNEPDRPADDSTYWTDVCSLTIAAGATPAEQNTTFTNKFRWYRRVVTKTAGTGQLTFTVCVVETTFDALIINKATELIYTTVNTGLTPLWGERRDIARANYDSAMQSIKFSVDENEDGFPDTDETTTGNVDAWR